MLVYTISYNNKIRFYLTSPLLKI